LKKSLTAATAVVGITAALLTGCSNDAGGDASSITIWHNTGDSPAILNLYSGFTEATGIEVELVPIPASDFENTVTTKWVAGDRPDVLEFHPTLAKILSLNPENLIPLDGMDFIEKSGDLYDSTGSANGHVYAAITGFPSIFGVYYNKAALEAAGLEPPQDFADLAASCDPLNANGVTPIYESAGSGWSTQVLPFAYLAESNVGDEWGKAAFANEEKLNDPDGLFVKAIQAYKDLQTDGCFQADVATGTFEEAIAQVVSGETAMAALHSDVYSMFVEAAGGDEQLLSDTVGFVGVSATSPVGWRGASPLGSYYQIATGNEAKQDAARQFIEYATGEGYAQLLEDSNTFPIMEGYEGPSDVTELQQAYKDVYDAGATPAPTGNLPGLELVAELQKVLADQQDAQQAAENCYSNVKQAAQAAGLEGW